MGRLLYCIIYKMYYVTFLGVLRAFFSGEIHLRVVFLLRAILYSLGRLTRLPKA